MLRKNFLQKQNFLRSFHIEFLKFMFCISSSNPMQPPMIGPLPVMLPQQPAPAAAAPFDFGFFMRKTGGNTIAFLSAIQKADKHLPIGPIHVYSDRG